MHFTIWSLVFPYCIILVSPFVMVLKTDALLKNSHGDVDCRHEFAQLLSDSCGLYFAISCLMVLLPMKPSHWPGDYQDEKEKKLVRMSQHTHVDWGSSTQTMLLLLSYSWEGKNNPTKFLDWSCGQCCPWGFRHCIWGEMVVAWKVTFLEGRRILICR